ncbi:STAS domain-containing protein [Streptomyces sp. HUAS MG91]|uniref:Anti-sigma factor antagonist n=1 Tax=Streptomyces tabacisoli TaxID=3156398 RepID=A0AAU8J338_9ACTN
MTHPHGPAEQPSRLSVSHSTASDIEIVTAKGEIDASNIAVLTTALACPDAASRAPRRVLDLGAVTFMDSTGINALLTAHRQAEEAGGWLRLANMDGPVLRLVELVGIDQVIACYPSVELARTS